MTFSIIIENIVIGLIMFILFTFLNSWAFYRLTYGHSGEAAALFVFNLIIFVIIIVILTLFGLLGSKDISPSPFAENLYKGGMKENGVDLSIGNTVIQKALENCFEKAILISGDADFVPVITKLKELGKKVEIWAFTKPEHNCALSPFLIYELSKMGDISSSLKSINSFL